MPSLAAIRAFLRLSRPKFLLGGIIGFALGAAIARFEGVQIGWQAYVQGQLMVSAFHAMVHYANDYYDLAGDAFSRRTPWSGGSGVLVDGLLSPRLALAAATVCAAAGGGVAIAFALQGKWLVAGLGLVIGLCAWFYSAPPLRLLARGWGEIDTALVIAILMPLAGYATFTGTLGVRALVSALPSAAAMLVLMFCVEYPDVESDARCGKRNLVVRVGRSRARLLVYGAVLAAYLAAALAIVLGAASTLAIFALLTLPLAWALVERLAANDPGQETVDTDIAAGGVAFFVATIFGSMLAYVAVL